MEGGDYWIFTLLVAARGTQFISTVVACGGMLFLAGILGPALNRSGTIIAAYPKLKRRLGLLIWVGLAGLFLSAFYVLALQSAEMSGAPLLDAASADILSRVLTETTFGNAWALRLVFLLLLMATWAGPTMHSSRWVDAVRVALALSVVGVLAWTGHANVGSGLQRSGHLAVDVLHLTAASAWLGALLPLAFVLRHSAGGALPFDTTRLVVLRFSNLGILSVAVLVVSGVLNTLMTIDTPLALFRSTYGRILVLKVSLFLVMLAFAAVNRQRLAPKLADRNETMAARTLGRNCLIEAALGGIILGLVAALGILPPEGQ